MTNLTSYAWQTGHNVALVNLRNVQRDLFPYTAPMLAVPRAGLVNTLPDRRQTLSQRTYGDGFPTLTWVFDALRIAALDYIIDTYISTGGVENASKAITIYTLRAERGQYVRYNAYLTLPVPGQDYTYRQNAAIGLTLTFTGLEAL